MKSKVEQYAKGDFYVEYPEVQFSQTYLQLKVEAGSICSGSISVVSKNDIPMKMMVYDDACFLHLDEHSIIGCNGKISYTFSGENKIRGNVYDGNLHIIGNGIEKTIPYNIEIVAPFIDLDKVAIEDLMKFSELAESDWEKAIDIFYCDEFAKTLLADNPEHMESYKSLCDVGAKDPAVRNQALEEFLVYIHKKRTLSFQVEHDRYHYKFPKMREDHELILNKNTWGYCKMKISSDSKFLVVHEKEICSMDFDDDKCVIHYSIDPEHLNEDKDSFGYITLENTYQEIKVSVSVKRKEEESGTTVKKNSNRKIINKEKSALVHNYLDYRIGLIPLDRFIDNARQILHNLVNMEKDNDRYRLGLLHMSIIAGQEEAVRQEIRRIEADEHNSFSGYLERCYYMYLKALLSKDVRQIVGACEEIEKALTVRDEKVFFFWLLLNLDERYQKDKQWLFSQIEGLYLGGYESPILAIEICDLFNQEPLLLRKLDSVELAALTYGLNNNYLSKEVIEEFLLLAEKEKAFSNRIFRLLVQVYELWQKPEIVRIICGMLIRGGRLETRYNKYYLEGIKGGYKLVGIQENYLRSIDKSRYDLIPDSVLRYFNYKSFLTDSEYAYLYANVVTNKRQYLSQYEEYLPNMLAFMEEQIVKGVMSDDLSVLYGEFLRPQSVNANYAAKLTNVIFKRKLTVASDDIVAVIVTHRELEKAQVVPVTNHVAYVDMITESAVITLVDRDSNRYISTIPYKLQKLVDEELYMDILSQYAGDDYRYILYRYDEFSAYDAKDAREVNIARDIMSFREISTFTKQQAIWGIVRYYNEHHDVDVLRSYLDRVKVEYVTAANGAEYINGLILCGLYDKAYSAIKIFGYKNVTSENLIRLVEALCEFSQYAREDTLLSIATFIYKGGMDTIPVLGYLVEYYQSGFYDMIKLWKRAIGRVKRLENFEENIICLALYTEQWDDQIFKIFESYLRKKKRGMVIKAFFKRASFAYIIEDKDMPEEFFNMLVEQMMVEEWNDDMCRAAILRYMSRKTKLDARDVEWIKSEVEYFEKKGILFPFFRHFKKYIKLPKDLFLLTYVVTKDKAGRQISFKYNIQSGAVKPELNRKARMMEVIPGYYMKEFVLFHGENLLYKMPEANVKYTKVYESQAMKAKGETDEYENRFEMINSMLLDQEASKNQALIDKIDKYLKLSAVMEENLEIL